MGAKRKATKASYGNKAAQMAAIASQGAAACAQSGFGAGFPEVMAKCKKITLAAAQSGQLPIAPTAPTVTPAYQPAYNAPTNYGVQQASSGAGVYNQTYIDPMTQISYPNGQDVNGNVNPSLQNQIASDESNFQSQQQSQYQQPAYGGQQGGGGSQFIYPFVDPMTGISYPNGQDQNGNQNPAIMAQVQSDEQAASGGGYGGGQQYGYAEGSGHGGVMHIVKMASPVIGLSAGLGVAFLVNKKVKDFGTKGLIGGMVVGTILGVLVPVLMHKPHVKKAPVAAVAPTAAVAAAK